MPASQERIQGCMMGLFVGDACGATLEFHQSAITEADVGRAMTLPGGGCHNVAPGQFTDDSELAIALLRALVRVGRYHDPRDGFPADSEANGSLKKRWSISPGGSLRPWRGPHGGGAWCC